MFDPRPPSRARLERDESGDLKDRKRQNGRSDAFEIGVIRVFSNPGPDAEDRLRRLMSLIVRHATRDGQAGPDKDSLSDAPTGEPRAAAKD